MSCTARIPLDLVNFPEEKIMLSIYKAGNVKEMSQAGIFCRFVLMCSLVWLLENVCKCVMCVYDCMCPTGNKHRMGNLQIDV